MKSKDEWATGTKRPKSTPALRGRVMQIRLPAPHGLLTRIAAKLAVVNLGLGLTPLFDRPALALATLFPASQGTSHVLGAGTFFYHLIGVKTGVRVQAPSLQAAERGSSEDV